MLPQPDCDVAMCDSYAETLVDADATGHCVLQNEQRKQGSHHDFNAKASFVENSWTNAGGAAVYCEDIEEGLPFQHQLRAQHQTKAVCFAIPCDTEDGGEQPHRGRSDPPRASAPRSCRPPRILPLDVIDVWGREEVTVSTLSFGQKAQVQVETPKEMPRHYVCVVITVVLSVSVPTFLLAFFLVHRSMN